MVAGIGEELKAHIRSIPDFPKKGIVFRDITTLLQDPGAFRRANDCFFEQYRSRRLDKVVSIESRGFIFGGVLASRLGAGFVPVRKPDKLPFRKLREEFQLEYGADALEIHADSIQKGEQVLVVDDLLATGGTARASCSLVRRLGGEIKGVAFLIELSFLKGREKLSDVEVFSVMSYDSE
ncbi:MAG: adenine phosphoribosyltransferase [Ignavibacteria bacterium]|nr:MAG: adenine phosphoribosyltransferase [Ignavibacteria bacterium]